MAASDKTSIRELDQRCNDGIEVRLLWDAHTDQVSLAVIDERSGESVSFEVDPAEALTAFRHPFAYAPHAAPDTTRSGGSTPVAEPTPRRNEAHTSATRFSRSCDREAT